MSSVDRLINHFGSPKAAAHALDITPMAISLWKKRGIPIKATIRIEEKTNGAITRSELRPDIFPPKAA